MKLLKFKTKFGEMGYYKIGEGEKIVVFLHGFLGRPMFLEKLSEIFNPKGYFITAPILLGHGQSFSPPGGFSFVDLSSCVEQFLLSFGVQNICLIGHSMGGGLSWQLGHRKTLAIKKVVMLSPGLGRFRSRNIEYVKRFAADLKFDYPYEWFVKYFLKAINKEMQWQQVVFPWRMEYMVRSLKVELTDFPEGVKAKALWGKDDLITPYEDWREELDKVKGLKVELFPGGHHWFIARKKEFFKEVEKFI